MIEAIDNISHQSPSINSASRISPDKAAAVQEEFLAIFYKELLKQAFSAPKLSMLGEDDEQNNTFTSAYSSDMLIEELAKVMVKNNSLQADLFDTAIKQ